MTFDWKQIVIGLMILASGLGGGFLMLRPPVPDPSPGEVVQDKTKDKTKSFILSFYNENKQIEKLEGVKVRVESVTPGQPEQSNDQGQVELSVLASSKKIDVFYEKAGFMGGRTSIDLETQSGKTIRIGLKPELDTDPKKKVK